LSGEVRATGAHVEKEVRVGPGNYSVEGDLARRVGVVELVPALVLGTHVGYVVPLIDRARVLDDPAQRVRDTFAECRRQGWRELNVVIALFTECACAFVRRCVDTRARHMMESGWGLR
jgi:hypothetical protein